MVVSNPLTAVIQQGPEAYELPALIIFGDVKDAIANRNSAPNINLLHHAYTIILKPIYAKTWFSTNYYYSGSGLVYLRRLC